MAPFMKFKCLEHIVLTRITILYKLDNFTSVHNPLFEMQMYHRLLMALCRLIFFGFFIGLIASMNNLNASLKFSAKLPLRPRPIFHNRGFTVTLPPCNRSYINRKKITLPDHIKDPRTPSSADAHEETCAPQRGRVSLLLR